MLNIPYVIDAQPNSVVVTDAITIDEEQTISIVSGVGTILKSGIAQASPCEFVVGDRLAIQMTVGDYGSTVFVVLGSNKSYDLSPVAASVMQKVEFKVYPFADGLRAVDLIEDSDGFGFIPSTDDDVFIVGTTNQNEYEIDLPDTTTYSAGSWFMLTDCLGYRARLFNLQGQCCKEWDFEVHLFGPWCQYGTKFAIAAHDDNKVLLVDLESTIKEQTIDIEFPAFASCAKNSVWIAYGDTKVCRYTKGVDFSVSVGVRVKEVLALSDDKAFVIADGQYGFVTSAGYTALGNLHIRAACIHNGGIAFVSGNSVTVVDASGAVLGTTLLEITAFPAAISSNGSSLLVGCFGDNSIRIIGNTYSVESSSPVKNSPYGVTWVGSTPCTAGIYSNRPAVLYAVDKTPTEFDLSDSLEAPRSTDLYSNDFVVSRIEPGFSLQASVPDLYGATIYKNGVASGTSTTAIRGDQISLRITTPSIPSVSVKVPLFLGDVVGDFTTKTSEYDATPDAFNFSDVANATVGGLYTSEEVTISGVDYDAGATISISSGTLYKNGLVVGQSWTNVVNGDKIKVSVTAPSSNNGAVIIAVTAGNWRTDWAITTPQSAQFYAASALTNVEEQLWPAAGPDMANSLLTLLISDMATSTLIPLDKTPSGALYDSENVVVLTDLALQNLYEINTVTNEFQRSLHVPHIVGSFSVSSGSGDTVSIFWITTSQIGGVDGDFNELWPAESHGYTDVVDGIAVNNGTSLFLAHSDGTVTHHTFNYATGELQVADASYNIGAKKFFHTFVGTKEYAIAYGDSITPLYPTVGATISQSSLTLDFNGTNIYTVDRVTNEIRVYALDATLVSSKKMPFALGDLALSQSNLIVSDLSGKRLVRLDAAFTEVASFSTSALAVDLTADKTNIYAYVRRSNLAEKSVLQDQAALSVFSKVENSAIGSSVIGEITLVNAARPVNIVSGSVYVPSPLSNGVASISATSSPDYYTELVSKFAINGVLYSWSVKTLPSQIPDYLRFEKFYDAVLSNPATSNEIVVSGLTDGFSVELTVEQGNTTVVFVVNGIAGSSTATVKNGDKLAVSVSAEGPYGSAHSYKVFSGNTEVGLFAVASIKLDKAIKFPAMNVRRTRLYPQPLPLNIQEKKAYTPEIIVSGILALDKVSAELLKAASIPSQVAAPELNTGSIYLGLGMGPVIPSSHVEELECATGEKLPSSIQKVLASEAEKDIHALYEYPRGEFNLIQSRYTINAKQTPFYLRPHMFLSNAKRLSPLHSSEHRSALIQKLYLKTLFNVSAARSNGWDSIKQHAEEGIAVWDKEEINWNAVDTAWIKYSFRQDEVLAVFQVGYPTTQLEVDTDWFSFGRHEERYSADWNSFGRHDESVDASFSRESFNWSEFFSSPVRANSVSVFEFKHNSEVAPATHGEEFKSTGSIQLCSAPYKFAASAVKRLDTSEKQFAAVTATSILHKMLTAFMGTKQEKINNLRTFSVLQPHVIADPVWAEPPITVPEDKGLFSSALLASQDAQANATHTYRAVQFKNGYLWNEDVDVMTKTCYSFGSMSRTPYRWNMQLRNCWADAKKSGYVGGG